MEILTEIFKRIKGLTNLYILFLIILVGVFLFLQDVPTLRKKKLMKEAKLAKALGYITIIGGFLGYIATRIF